MLAYAESCVHLFALPSVVRDQDWEKSPYNCSSKFETCPASVGEAHGA